MKKSVTATVLACALVVGGVGLTPAGAAESSADVCYSVSIDKSSIVAADTRTEMIGFKELSTQAVDPAVLSESKGGSMTRATSRIDGLSAIGVYRMQFILIRRERCYRFNRRYT